MANAVRYRPILACASLCVLALLVAACAGNGRGALADSPASAESDQHQTTDIRELGGRRTTLDTITAEQARAGVADVEVLTGPPPTDDQAPSMTAGASPLEVVDTFPVDALVGHINGRPLFASDFFEPMDNRLRALARELQPREWLIEARELISESLRDRVRDDLLLAEFEASLTPEEKAGLFYFMEQVRSGLISGSLGSESLANRRLLEEEDLTLDQMVRQIRDRELIRVYLMRALADRTYVSWREVQQQYERDADLYNPPPLARFRVIYANADDAERIERITEALAAGEEFAEVARRESAFRPESGGLVEVQIKGAPYDQFDAFFGPAELNEQARKLSPGQTAGPFPFGDRRAWMRLESVEHESHPLFDVQLEIYDKLRKARELEEQTDYFLKLVERGSLSDIREMERRLVELAAERYLVNAPN